VEGKETIPTVPEANAPEDDVGDCRKRRGVPKCERCLRYGSPDPTKRCPYGRGD